MMDIDAIEKELAAQLNPLRLALEQNNVLVAALPKHSSAYSSEVREGIDVIHSKASGLPVTGGSGFQGFQDIQHTITINISLGLRYQDDPEEKNVLNWVCKQVFKLLYNFQLKNAKTALSFVDYTPLLPENGQWSAQMQFTFLEQATAYETPDDESLAVEFVRLFAKDETNTALITQIPRV